MEMIKISENEMEKINEAARKNKNKRVEKKLQAVIDRLCYVIKNLPSCVIQSITARKWIMSMF